MWALILFVIIYLFLLWLIYSRFFGAEYFPTSRKVAKQAITMLKLNKRDVFYDLGCGGGAVVFLAEKISKCKAIGIEVDFLRWLYAFFKGKIIGSKAKFIFGSYNQHNTNNATAIFVFLKQGTNQKLKKKFLKLKKGTKIISYMHTFDNWKPVRVDKKNKLALYILGKSERFKS